MNAYAPQQVKAEFSPRSVIRTIWKQKILLVICWLVLTVIVVGLVSKLPAIYTAEATILVDSQKIPEKYVVSTVSTDVQDRLATISQQVLSSSKLKKIIDDFGLYREEQKTHVQEEIIEMMRKDIGIKLERGWSNNRPGAFRVSYQGPDPAVVAEVTNKIATFFIDENLRTREIQAAGTSEFITNQLAEAKKMLDVLEERVSKYKLEHNGELPQQENTLVSTLARLQIELQGSQDSSNRSQESKVVLENSLLTAEGNLATLSQTFENAQAASREALRSQQEMVTGGASAATVPARRKLDVLQNELDSLRVRYQDNHPDIKRLQNEIARVKEEQAKETVALNPVDSHSRKTEGPTPVAAVSPAKPAALEAIQQLTQIRSQISNIKAQLKVVNEQLEMRAAEQERVRKAIVIYQGRLEKLPIREQEMAALTRDYEISKANYKSLLDKRLAADMATDLERRQKAETFLPLDPARPPEKPSKPNRPLLDALGSLLGLVLGSAVSFAVELKKNYVLGEWELPKGLSILGRVPYIELGAKLEDTANPGHSRWWRLALLSSALVSLLAVIAAGAYFAWNRF